MPNKFFKRKQLIIDINASYETAEKLVTPKYEFLMQEIKELKALSNSILADVDKKISDEEEVTFLKKNSINKAQETFVVYQRKYLAVWQTLTGEEAPKMLKDELKAFRDLITQNPDTELLNSNAMILLFNIEKRISIYKTEKLEGYINQLNTAQRQTISSICNIL